MNITPQLHHTNYSS